MNPVEQAIEKAGRAGIRPVDIRRQTNLSDGTVAAHLVRMLRSGKIVRVTTGFKHVLYFMAGLQPEGADTTTTTRQMADLNRDNGRSRQRLQGEAIMRAGVRFTICPCGKDTRYTPDPRLAGRGVITSDWMARRQAEAR